MANKKTSEKQKMLAEQRKAKRREGEKTERKKSRRKKGILAAAICVVSAAVIAGGCVWAVKTQPLTHMLPVEKTEHYSLNAAEMSFYSWQIYQQYLNNNTSRTQKRRFPSRIMIMTPPGRLISPTLPETMRRTS